MIFGSATPLSRALVREYHFLLGIYVCGYHRKNRVKIMSAFELISVLPWVGFELACFSWGSEYWKNHA